jgi:hypothetical protein
MDYPWRYHPEFEIIFVEKSNGIRLMGNHAGSFSDGDLMFIHWKYLSPEEYDVSKVRMYYHSIRVA